METHTTLNRKFGNYAVILHKDSFIGSQMFNQIYWCHSNRVICAEFSGLITFDETLAALYECGELFKQVNHQLPIHVIFYNLLGSKIDTHMTDLNQLKEIYAYQRNPTGGQFVLVDPSMHPLLRSIGTIAARLAGQKLVIAPTVDSALEKLNLLDSSIQLHSHQSS